MILSDFLVETKTGLFCAYGNFYLDPKEGVKDAVISHAHGDHAIGGNLNVYCTKATSLFMSHRYKSFAAGKFHVRSYNEPFQLNGVKISFIPAGHILGSSQILMEYKNVKYLYTGDYKLQQDDTCEPISFQVADVLITESTFANPQIKHPLAENEIIKLKATRSTIMLGAYAVGKCQRLISLINKHCIEKRIMIHQSMMPFIKIYEQMGVTLGPYEHYDKRVIKANVPDLIYLVPPMVFNSSNKAINVVRVFATGWSNLQKTNGMQLFISDHADWNDIIYTIKQVKPLQVWTTHGSGLQLKSYYENSLVVKLLN